MEKLYINLKRLKNIPLKNDDIYVASQTGDRLDLLLINIMVRLLVDYHT